MERSLDLSSKELLATNHKLRQETEADKLILDDLRKATAALRPEENHEAKWLTSHDEVAHLANSLTKLIEDRKLQERKLIRLASFPEENPNPVVEVDMKGTIIYGNPISKRIFPELHIGLAQHPLLEGFTLIVETLVNGQKEYETREISIDGKIYEQKICFVAKSNVVIFFISDITESKKAEMVLTNFPEGIFAVDELGVIIYMNDTAQQSSGFSVKESLNQHFEKIFKFTFTDLPQKTYTILINGIPPDKKLLLHKKNGETLEVYLQSVQLNHNTGLKGKVFVFRT